MACAAAKEQAINYPKISQKEGKYSFMVSDFPDTFAPTIKLVVENYFEGKKLKEIEKANKPIVIKKEAVKPKPVFDNNKINVQIKKVRKRIPLKPELKKK